MNDFFERSTQLNDLLKNGVPTGTVRFEDSAMGKQAAELKRIADAAQKRAELAEKRAEELKIEAKKAKRGKIISSVFAFISFLSSVFMWLFTRDEVITALAKLF